MRDDTSRPASRAVSSARAQQFAGVGHTGSWISTGCSDTAGCGAAEVRAAVGRHSVPGRAELTGRSAYGRLAALGRGALGEQVADDRDEARVGAGGGGAGEVQADLGGGRGGLGVEVVDDLHVVGDEADRHEHDRGRAGAGQLADPVVDVGLEPRRRR